MNNLEEMEKFLETRKLLRLNHEVTENLNISVTSKEVESVIRNFWRKPQNQQLCWLSLSYNSSIKANSSQTGTGIKTDM